jgi:hypothetical protein
MNGAGNIPTLLRVLLVCLSPDTYRGGLGNCMNGAGNNPTLLRFLYSNNNAFERHAHGL